MSENNDLAKRFDAFARAYTLREENDRIYTYIAMEGPEGNRREVRHMIDAGDLARAARALDALPMGHQGGDLAAAIAAALDDLWPQVAPDGWMRESHEVQTILQAVSANQTVLGGVTIDELARAIDPDTWDLSYTPEYANRCEAFRNGMFGVSREAAERVQALLAHRAETGAAVAGPVALPASGDVARAVQEYTAHQPRVAVGVRYWCGVCEISMDGRHVAMMHAMERALAVHESRPKA